MDLHLTKTKVRCLLVNGSLTKLCPHDFCLCGLAGNLLRKVQVQVLIYAAGFPRPHHVGAAVHRVWFSPGWPLTNTPLRQLSHHVPFSQHSASTR